MIIPAPNNQGHLYCDECHNLWCIDVEEHVRQYEDAHHIWAMFPQSQDIEVPIVPTQNVWCSVTLEPSSSGTKSYEMIAKISDMLSGHLHSEDDFELISIGYVNPGEGRLTFREMLLQWFVAAYEPIVDVHGCKAAGHGYHQVVRWNTDMKSTTQRIVQQWTLLTTGKCLGCTFDPSTADQYVPDINVNPWST